MNTFPTELNAWKNDVARRLVALRGTFNDLMMALPMIPDPEIGQPFTGPLSPVPFEWPTRPDRSGGTNTGGTIDTGGTLVGGCAPCDAAGHPVCERYQITISSVANQGCTDCANLNGTYIVSRSGGSGGGAGTGSGCVWTSIETVTICGSSRQLNFQLERASSTKYTFSITNIPTDSVRWGYAGRDGCPPPAGTTDTLNKELEAGSACNYPATITVKGL